MKRVLSTLALALLVAPSYSDAQNMLWDQQPDADLVSAVNQQFGDFPDFSTYIVNDVTFNTDVHIDSVTTYFTNTLSSTWLSVTQGVLNIFNGDSLMTGDDPTSGGDFGLGLVDVTVIDIGSNILVVRASGLNIKLTAGTYWFGLTPFADFSMFGQEFHHDSGSTIGFGSQYRNPGAGFGLPAGTQWGNVNPDVVPGYGDASMTIRGTVIPEPSSTALLGVCLIAGWMRRRR